MAKTSYSKAILTNLHALEQRRFTGDLNASDTLIDFDAALKKAKLTAKQSRAIHLVYVLGMKQVDAAKEMGIGQDVVSEHIRKATKELDEVYEMWAWLDGDLSVSDFENDELEAV